MIISEETIKNKIYIIRGQRVMLDMELAEIYGYTTKAFNQQVKNNIHKFDDDFRFQLTKDEWANLRSKKLTSSWGGTRYLPYAFTEQGIYMLMTVLKGDLATKQSKSLIRLFKKMKDYLVTSSGQLGQQEILSLAMQTQKNTDSIQALQEQMKQFATKDDLAVFMENFMEYPHVQITLQQTGGRYHDRFIMLDYGSEGQRLYHCGGSSKDSGRRVTAISPMDDVSLYQPMFEELLQTPTLVLR